MVVVIGYQAENDWLDVINVKLPTNPAQTSVAFDSNTSNTKWMNKVFSFPTSRLASYTHHFIFTTSFGVEGIGFNGNNRFEIYKGSGSTTSTSLQITISAYL